MGDDERSWEYELWVHLSDHVKQKQEPGEPDDCEHCKTAEVDCDDCRLILVEWEQSLGDDGESLASPTSTHQIMRRALEYISTARHSTCAGLPYCHSCVAAEALRPPTTEET